MNSPSLLLAAALAFIAIPGAAVCAEPSTDAELREAWVEVQSGRRGQSREGWWQSIDATRLSVYVRAGVDVNIENHRGWTPLHSAARYSTDPAVLSVLLEAGADVNEKDRAGDTPLHWAASDNPNAQIVKLLIKAGANVNATDRFGWLPIHTAADRSANPKVIDALLAAGSSRKRRAYFLLFSPSFLLKHNSNMSDADKEIALARLKGVAPPGVG